ncbi:hypothetical protein RHSIM_Rhsim03G0138400 [Rhododendron simsii]|uniref:Uncharacterized protein n=1 Tax=Rhododendron simsii TaxID=118357 RepID=A0A834LTR5_RHOSS|nr:hypothetical protein RHSIM_Rhsim03G0138400 [Rhododendron simsii]
MTGAMDNRDFWLPSEFLTADDMLMGKENFNKNNISTAFATNFGFPTDFPYEFGSSLLSSPVESVVGSTETESDEDDLLAGLARRFARSSLNEKALKITSAQQNLEKSWAVSGSPQSTLSAVGSWSVSPSPPATPLGGNNDGWDLMYAEAAAGQLARLKMNGEGLSPTQILTPIQHSSHPVRRNPNTAFYANQSNSHTLSHPNHLGNLRKEEVLKQQWSCIWGRQIPSQQQGFQSSSGGYERQVGLSEPAWLPVQVQRQNHPSQRRQCGGSGMRAVFLGGSGGKRECAGTGVFIPRRYGSNNPSECRKKPGCDSRCSAALLPARVVQALNNGSFDNMASQSQAQPQFNNAFGPEYDNLMMRNAMLNHQQRWSIVRPELAGMRRSHDLCLLPQEWTY